VDFLDLYQRLQRVWVLRRSSEPPVAIRQALTGPKRMVVCVGNDPRLPPLVFPALRLLREHYQSARLLLVAGPASASAFRREQIADKTMVLQERTGLGLLREVRRLGGEIARLDPDLLLLLEAEPTPAFLALAHESRVPLRIGFGRGEYQPYLNFEVAPPGDVTYLAQALLRLAGALTGRFVHFLDGDYRWRVTDSEARRAERLIHFWQPRSEQPLFAIEPGRESEGKAPDLEKYGAVAKALARAYGARILVLAPPEDRPVAEELVRRLAGLDPYRAQTDDMAQAIAFLSRVDLLVTSNTPLFHYGVALGVPVVGLFPERVEPWLVPPADTAAVILPLHKEITEERFLDSVDTLATAAEGSTS